MYYTGPAHAASSATSISQLYMDFWGSKSEERRDIGLNVLYQDASPLDSGAGEPQDDGKIGVGSISMAIIDSNRPIHTTFS